MPREECRVTRLLETAILCWSNEIETQHDLVDPRGEKGRLLLVEYDCASLYHPAQKRPNLLFHLMHPSVVARFTYIVDGDARAVLRRPPFAVLTSAVHLNGET